MISFDIAGAEVVVLIGQDYMYEVKFADETTNTKFSKLPKQKHPKFSERQELS